MTDLKQKLDESMRLNMDFAFECGNAYRSGDLITRAEANAMVQAEREACAALCERAAEKYDKFDSEATKYAARHFRLVRDMIHARSEAAE